MQTGALLVPEDGQKPSAEGAFKENIKKACLIKFSRVSLHIVDHHIFILWNTAS